jgi:polar amino acid transport system substrate-binding protein
MSSRRPSRKAAWLVLVLLALAPAARAERPLRFLTNDNPPYSMIAAGRRVIGISADIVAEMAARAGVPAEIETYPWARAYDEALHQPDTCAFSTTRTTSREALFQWIGPIATNSWALFARDDFPGTLASLDAARRYVIGGQLAEAKAAYLTERGLTVDPLPDDDLNPQRLAQGRIDLWVSGLYTAPAKAAAVGIRNIKPVLVFHQALDYLACNEAVPAATIRRLREALETMRADGKLAAITRFYQGPATPPVD